MSPASPSPFCPACGDCTWQPVFEVPEMFGGELFALMRCSTCDLVRTAFRLSDEERASYHHTGTDPDAGKRFRGLVEPLMRAARHKRVRKVLAAHPRAGRILDVGCGRGVMLYALAELGWDVYGTELDEVVAATARAFLPHRVHTGGLDDLDPPAPFDVITFWHVLEHLPDPGRSLARAAELLSPDGTVIVGVPNIDSWQARLFGRYWLHLDVPRHAWHFSPKTLARLAAASGLAIADIEHFSLEYGPYGMFQSALAKAGLGHTLYARLLRPGRARPLWQEPSFWAHVALAAPLALMASASVPLEVLAAARGRGGSIVAKLRRVGARS